MKCDELKVYHCNEWHNEYTEFYMKYDVDAAIDEIKAKHHKERHEYINMIAELKEERRWRKCSEELPEDGAEVLATDGENIWLCHKDTVCDGSPWFQPDGLPHIEGVTHWKPLCGDLVDLGDVCCMVKAKEGFDLEYWKNFECQHFVKINFCPMCGRKLSEKQ